MSNQGNFMDNMRAFWESSKPVLKKIGRVFQSIGMTLRMICSAVYKVRGIFISIPVAAVAIYLALRNQTQLPDMVGLIVAQDGGFSYVVPRSIAVYGPLAITIICLLMVLCSRKTLYPWVISVFSLVLPLMIWFINSYPL